MKISKDTLIIILKTGTNMFVCMYVKTSVCERVFMHSCACGCGGQRTTMGVIPLSFLVRNCLLTVVELAK